MKLDVISRRLGGHICIALCSDGIGHVFAWSDDSGPLRPSACGSDVSPVRGGNDDEEVCESCAAAAESWAMGGLLRVAKD